MGPCFRRDDVARVLRNFRFNFQIAISVTNRHCERSEAIHTTAKRKNGLLRRVAPLRKRFAFVAGNDGETNVRILAARGARGVREFSPFENRGRRESRVPMHPQPRVQCRKHTSVVTTGSPETIPAFPAQWFYGFLRALPGDRACLPPSSCASSRKT